MSTHSNGMPRSTGSSSGSGSSRSSSSHHSSSSGSRSRSSSSSTRGSSSSSSSRGSGSTRVAGEAVAPPKRNNVRRDVQGLRALAVLVVILNHMLGWPTGGFIGVDVFFVLSGYLITGLMLREHDRTGTISFVGFYKRRIKRIMPAAVLVLLVTVIASYVLTPGVRYFQTLNDSFWALIFSANWNMAIQGTDYFQADMLPSPVQHYWSLAVEEQFYFVWPWVMLGILAVGIKLFSWSSGAKRAAVGIAIGVISIASFAYAMILTPTDLNLAYFSSLDRAWELGAGALIAVFGTYFTAKAVALRTAMSWIGFAAIIIACFVVDPAAGFPAPWAALPVLATALVLLAGEQGTQPFLWPLTNRVSQYLGDISYSLYLWHFPVLILLLALMPGDNIVYYLISTAIILVISVLSYHFVEDPIRKSKWLSNEKLSSRQKRRRKQKRKDFLTSTGPKVGVLVLAGVVAVSLLYVAFVRTDTVEIDAADAALPANLAVGAVDDPARCLGAPTLDPNSGCEGVDIGTNLHPAATEVEDDRLLIDHKQLCWIEEGKNDDPCHYGSDEPDALKVAVVGDSHAQSFLPSIIKGSVPNNWSITAYTGLGCTLSTVPDKRCIANQDKILAAVSSGEYDIVITQSSRGKQTSIQGLSEAFQRVMASGSQVIAVSDPPKLTEEAFLCVQRVGFDPKNNDCGASAEGLETDNVALAAAQTEGAKLLDLTQWFCVDNFCPSVVGNVPIYRDSTGHITQTYAESMSQYVIDDIRALAGLPAPVAATSTPAPVPAS